MSRHNNSNQLTLALPSKGALGDDAMNFLANAGMRVYKPNDRQYIATIPTLKGVEVVFQRPLDVLRKVMDGGVDIGITGFDVFEEHKDESGDTVFIDKLGFGACELVTAVPESWIDVTSVDDLADIALVFKEKGKSLRIATKYKNLTRKWLYDKGITNFTLVDAEGALEAAPNMGYADLIVDITATGTTLKENRLRVLLGGTILSSEACLIGNTRNLRSVATKLRLVKNVLELIEAHKRSRQYIWITANISGDSVQEVGDLLLSKPILVGMIGPTISPIQPKIPSDRAWFAISIVVEKTQLLGSIDDLRGIGGTDITIVQPTYVFDAKSYTYERLEGALKGMRNVDD